MPATRPAPATFRIPGSVLDDSTHATRHPPMVNPGTRLGSYEIGPMIGVGGMGEVYRARDTKLNRDVAVKVLPAALSRDTHRSARLLREAQVLASLNHPNIAAIHGLEESTDGVHA